MVWLLDSSVRISWNTALTSTVMVTMRLNVLGGAHFLQDHQVCGQSGRCVHYAYSSYLNHLCVTLVWPVGLSHDLNPITSLLKKLLTTLLISTELLSKLPGKWDLPQVFGWSFAYGEVHSRSAPSGHSFWHCHKHKQQWENWNRNHWLFHLWCRRSWFTMEATTTIVCCVWILVSQALNLAMMISECD